MRSRDARIVLTGANGGIGSAIAERLVRAGAAVMLVGRSPARLASQARALSSAAGREPLDESRVAWRVADLTDANDVRELAASAAAWRCNVLVHAAGLPAFGSLSRLEPATLQALVDINLVAPVLLTQALLPHLTGLRRAQVVFVGSALGAMGLPGFAAYSATKFGLRGFAEALRRELADSGVAIQYLGPRSTATPFNDAGVEEYLRVTGAVLDTPERVAAAFQAALENGRPESYVGFPEKWAVRVNALAGSWFDGVFRKHRRWLQLQHR